MSCTPACATCERLRGAALELIGQGGIEALTEESLATRAALAPGDLGDHYRTPADCLYETYDEIASDVIRDLVHAFSNGSDWRSALELSRRLLLERILANPAQARLCFVESVRGDRELRRRHDLARRWIVRFLAREHARRYEQGDLPAMQFEMLVGAGFQTVARAVGSGDSAEVLELDPALSELLEWFIPEPVASLQT
jgi:AcrR family transcriptional regulator